MSMIKRKFNKTQKLSMLQEAQKHGVKPTLEKNGIYPATFYNWKTKYESMGEYGLSPGMTQPQLKEIRRLEKENRLFRQIIADKELEGKLKDDLLEKKYPLQSSHALFLQIDTVVTFLKVEEMANVCG